MSQCTYEELKQELGKSYGMEAIDNEKTRARVMHSGGDIHFIDFEDGRIETELCVRWRKAEAPSVSEGFPDAGDIAVARLEILEKLLPDWEAAGFTAEGRGSPATYWYKTAPDRKKTKLAARR